MLIVCWPNVRLFQCDTYPHLKVKFKSIYIYLSNLHNDNTDFIIINHSCERCYRGVQTSTPVYTLNCKCPVVILTAALFSVFFLNPSGCVSKDEVFIASVHPKWQWPGPKTRRFWRRPGCPPRCSLLWNVCYSLLIKSH